MASTLSRLPRLLNGNSGAVGDFDLDGVSDLMAYAPSSGTVARWTMHGRHATPTYEMIAVGTNWYML